MLRLVPFAVITLSCSSAENGNPFVDAGGVGHSHDGRGASVDAEHVTGIDAGPTTDAPIPCKPPNIIHGDGQHNPNMDCMSGCHDHGFSIAGTLLEADIITPASNATVTVVDANGGSQDIIVSTNGNFFSYIPVTFPVAVRASMCPTTQVMTDPATAGGCNATGCHDLGGLQGPMHL